MPGGNPFWPEDPTAGDILPLRRDASGLHLAAPNALRGAVNQLVDFAQLPDDVYHGRVGSNSDLAQRTNAGALSLLGLGAGLPAEEGAMKIFGGVSARGANIRKLRNAAAMELKGADPQSIWGATGWYRAPDDRWRFEIPDIGKAKLNTEHFTMDYADRLHLAQDLRKPQITLGDVLDHPDLYEHYPDLKNVKVVLDENPNRGGYYSEGRDEIGVAPSSHANALSTILHETQHAIQGREGFARGAGHNTFWPAAAQQDYKDALGEFADQQRKLKASGVDPDYLANVLHKMNTGAPLYELESGALQKALNKAPHLVAPFNKAMMDFQKQDLIKQGAYDNYLNVAGEVEARNVQSRFDYPGSEIIEPGFTSGYGRTGQILNFPGQRMTYSASPVDHDPFASVAVQPVEHNPFEQQVVPVDHDPFQVEKENE